MSLKIYQYWCNCSAGAVGVAGLENEIIDDWVKRHTQKCSEGENKNSSEAMTIVEKCDQPKCNVHIFAKNSADMKANISRHLETHSESVK